MLVLAVLLCLPVFSQKRVRDTKHNLSATGPGEYKALDETRICFFCHTPHSAEPKQPLWNHKLSAVKNYRFYQSPSFDAGMEALTETSPNGYSKLCLSCHDGTVALGAVNRRKSKAPFKGKMGALPPSAKSFIGTDLSGMHPISFVVNNEIIAKNNAKDTPLRSLDSMKSDRHVKLDAFNRMQCTSCHDAHSDENFSSSGVHFWKKSSFNEVCDVCHIF